MRGWPAAHLPYGPPALLQRGFLLLPVETPGSVQSPRVKAGWIQPLRGMGVPALQASPWGWGASQAGPPAGSLPLGLSFLFCRMGPLSNGPSVDI